MAVPTLLKSVSLLCLISAFTGLTGCTNAPRAGVAPIAPNRPVAEKSGTAEIQSRWLLPAVEPGWMTAAEFDDEVFRKYRGRTLPDQQIREFQLNSLGLTRSAHYERDGVYVTVYGIDLLDAVAAGEIDRSEWPLFQDRKHIIVSVFVSIEPLDSASVNLDRVSLSTPCGPGVTLKTDGQPGFRRIDYRKVAGSMPSDRPWGPGVHSFALVMRGDPYRIKACTLHLADAIRPKSGQAIPDLHFAEIDAPHEIRMVVMRGRLDGASTSHDN